MTSHHLQGSYTRVPEEDASSGVEENALAESAVRLGQRSAAESEHSEHTLLIEVHLSATGNF